MKYYDMSEAVRDAEETLNQANRQMDSLAKLMKGKLRLVSNSWQGSETLKSLKRELSQFNASTGEWKS